MIFFDYFEMGSEISLYMLLTVRTLSLMSEGLRPFVPGKGKKGFDKILEILFIPGLIAWSYEIIISSSGLTWHIFPKLIYARFISIYFLKIIGTVMISAGFILFLSSLISFGNSWRIGIDKQDPGNIVTTGVYSISRNPIFVFIDLYFFGTCLIYGNIFFLVFAVAVILGMHYQILQEEKFLKIQQGRKYLDYMKTVRRYV